jgi:type I site-specific restriction-modification system R (restriction) subunit
MNENCTSKDLENAINKGIKIIATTIQKFPNIKDSVKKVLI